MGFYPNQKQIRINREQVKKGSTKLFLVVYQDNIIEASRLLTHTAFKVYVCLLLNKSGYLMEYSPKYVSQTTGLCLDTARKALTELINKNFLIQSNERRYLYDFYEIPQKQNKINLYREKREFIDDTTGEIIYLTYAELLDSVGNEVEAKQIWEDAKNEYISK